MLLATKLTRPLLPQRLLARDHLVARLDALRACRLVLVTAPAGYGKTTLAALWLDRMAAHAHAAGLPPASAWVTLDEQENDPVQLVRYLIAAIDAVAPKAGHDARIALNQTNPVPRQALVTLLTTLHAWPHPIYLVLDDLHRLTDKEALELVTLLVEHSPPALHLLLLSRQGAPFPLARLRLTGQVAELGAEDLRLLRDEVDAYIALSAPADLDPSTVDLLADRAEGWMVGLQLLLLYLGKQAQSGHSMATLARELRGDNYLLAAYLSEEVVAQQSAQVRRFLLETSILDRLSIPLCEAVTELPNSGQLLERIAEAGLFLRALDPTHTWFQYHHLFRELLHAQLVRKHSAGVVRRLHLRAADWHADQDDVEAALPHYLAAGDPNAAADLLDRHSRTALLNHELVPLRRWLALLPEEVLARHPQLLLDLAWTSLIVEDGKLPAAVARVEQALARYPAGQVVRRWQDELAALQIFTRTIWDYSQADFAGHRALVDTMDPESHMARGWTALTVGAHALSKSLEDEGLPLLRRAEAEFTLTGDINGLVSTLGLRAVYYCVKGDSQEGLAGLKQVLAIHARLNYRYLYDAITNSIYVGQTLYHLNQIDEAQGYLRQAQDLLRLADSPLLQLWAHWWLQLCAVAQGLPPEPPPWTPEEEQAMWRQIALTQTDGYVASLYLTYVHLCVLQGTPERLAEAGQAIGRTVDDLNDEVLFNLQMSIIAGTLLGVPRPSRSALQKIHTRLRHLLAQAFAQKALSGAQLGEILLVVLLEQMGQQQQAAVALRRAVDIAEQTGYVRYLLDIPTVGVVARRSRTLSQRLARVTGVRPISMGISAQEQCVLVLIAQGSTNQEIATALTVTLGTVKKHISSLYAKLGVKSRTQALLRAQELGLLTVTDSRQPV